MLTAEGVQRLADRGVRTVFDLRSPKEREEFATPDLGAWGVQQVSVAVFDSDASPVGLADTFPDYATVYRRFLDTGAEAYRVLVETLAASEGGFLFHCAVGKDRTGVAAALLLSLVGVERETIVTDYAQSAELLRPMLPMWQEGMAKRGLAASRAKELMASEPEDMRSLLQYVDDRWQSAEGYLRWIGVGSTSLYATRARLLDER